MSTPSKVSMANLAITKVGGARITSFGDDSPEARAIVSVYGEIRDEVLCEALWTFSQTRFALTQKDEDPVWTDDGMTIVYARPSDLIKINFVNFANARIKLEAAGILSDTSGLKILYTARVDDPVKYFPAFTNAMSTRLAAEIAFTLTTSRTLARELLEKYIKIDLPKAVAQDSQQGSVIPAIQDEWTGSRIAGTGSAVVGRAGQQTWHPFF